MRPFHRSPRRAWRNLRCFFGIFHDRIFRRTVAIKHRQLENCVRIIVLSVATNSSKVLCTVSRSRSSTERTWEFVRNPCHARLADHPAAAEANDWHVIHVPILEADRACPRPEPRRRRLRLRVLLAQHARGLLFGGDARADLVGVRPRRGAVDHLLRRRRRGRRRLGPRRLRRALVANLLASLPVPAIAPVDALTVRRAVPAGSRVTGTCRAARERRPRPNRGAGRALCRPAGAIELGLFTADGARRAELGVLRPGLDLLELSLLDLPVHQLAGRSVLGHRGRRAEGD